MTKKFKDYVGEYFFFRPGTTERVSVEVRPAFRVLVHDERDNGGEVYFLNTKILQARINQEGWIKVDDPDEILPMREIADFGDGPVSPSESLQRDERDLQRVVASQILMPPTPHTLEGAYPYTAADPKDEKWLRFEHKNKGKFNLWHQAKSITGSNSRWTRPGVGEANWVTTQFRCGNLVSRPLVDFETQVEYGSRPNHMDACSACFSTTKPWDPIIIGLPKESLGWYASPATTQEK